MSGSDTSGKTDRKLILVVDDDPSVRSLVARALSPLYDIREASDGLKAAEAIAELPTPDLLLLDIMMPNADGITFAHTLKQSAAYKGIPIIFLTARSGAADVVQGIQAGARAYLTKPFKLDELRKKVAKILG